MLLSLRIWQVRFETERGPSEAPFLANPDYSQTDNELALSPEIYYLVYCSVGTDLQVCPLSSDRAKALSLQEEYLADTRSPLQIYE